MKAKTLAALLGSVALLHNPALSNAGVYDSFEDGKIDSTQWVTHGRHGGIGGIGAGSWQTTFTENANGDDDGYLETRVFGPPSGNTFWGEAILQTSYNFNDGKRSVSNFTLETNIGYNPHADIFAIQVTNGRFPDTESFTWPIDGLPEGTLDLWHYSLHVGGEPTPTGPIPPFSKTSWSIEINPSGTASLYQSPDASGILYSQIQLDPNEEWHIRFVAIDATSSGFSPGDNNFRLYDFTTVPEPTGLALLGLGALASTARRRFQ